MTKHLQNPFQTNYLIIGISNAGQKHNLNLIFALFEAASTGAKSQRTQVLTKWTPPGDFFFAGDPFKPATRELWRED